MMMITMKELKVGDYVEIINGPFKSYYAVVTNKGYGDEWEIQYFKKMTKWWVLNDNDLDSRERNELRIVTCHMDERSHYYF